MTKRVFSLVILASLLSAFVVMTAFAAKSPVKERKVDPRLTRVRQYSFPDEHNVVPGGAMEMPKAALGAAAPSASPGVTIGDTWYDQQRNGSMRRMIARNTTDGTQRVHFVWMRLASSVFTARKCYYSCYNPVYGELDCEHGVPIPDDEYAGYCVVNVTGDDRGVPGGHNNPLPGLQFYQSQFWWDDCPGCCDFYTTCRVPDDLGDGCQIGPVNDDGFIWPAMCLQEGGVDTIMHVFAQESNEGINPQAIAYFRTTNPLEYPCAWDYANFYCVDTVNTLSQDCDCTDDGKVVIAWTANLPIPGDCDTCSSHDYWGFTQANNDLYVQVSHDGGVNWDPRINVTKNVEGEEGWRPYIDLSVLIDSRDSVHVVWNARYWPADAEETGLVTDFRCRVFHWSGVNGSKDPNDINMVHDADWVPDECAPGALNLNASKMTISECDNKMYVLFTQFNDSNAVPAVMDDCAVKSSPGGCGYRGRANGDLFVCVSNNWGDNWDKARNLTNSYTPGCTLVAEGQGNCDNDHWASMVKFGTYDDGSGIWPDNIVDPSVPPDSPYTGNWFLDVQYVNDNSAGGIVQDEGWWTQSDVKWFRLPCVEPVVEADLALTPTEYGYPTWTKHGVQKDTTLLLENTGNCPLTYTITKFETTPPPSWLSVAPGGGTVVAGGSDFLTVGLNVGGMVNVPGTIVHLVGSLFVDWQGSGCPPTSNVREVVPVDCWVADTLIEPVWDTISTYCTRLTVANTGNFGHAGIGHVNMDYVDAGDCDPDADVYLYDGSPVIGYQKNGGTDTVVNFSIFGTSYIDENGFVPLGAHTSTIDMGDYYVFETGKFVTHDSLIAIEKVWYAPRTHPDTCSFVIERITVYLNDTLEVPPTDVRIAEAIDWDIPSDSGTNNLSGFDYPLNLLWQQGTDTVGHTGCQLNTRRWGGIDFLEVYKNGVLLDSFPYGGYIKDNATQVYPEGGFHPDSLYKHMGYNGFSNTDSQNTDLHVVMTSVVLDVLLKTDTFVIYTGIVTHWNGNYQDFLDEIAQSKKWYDDHINPDPSCVELCGDANHSGSGGVDDITYLHGYLFMDGPEPPCYEEADMDYFRIVTLRDLIYLVEFWFFGGPEPFCQPSGPLGGPVDSNNYLEIVETIFPANETSMTLHFNLTTSVTLHMGVLPFRIRVDGEVPSVTNCQLTSLLDAFTFARECRIDDDSGKVMFLFGNYTSNGVGPLSGEMATVDISIPASPANRPITIAWDPFPPMHHDPPDYDSAYSYYPLLVGPGPSKTPHLIIRPCCNHDGMRGDANYDMGINVGDLAYLVDYLFGTPPGPAPPCFEEADVDAGGSINVGDVAYLVDYLFSTPTGPPPEPCP